MFKVAAQLLKQRDDEISETPIRSAIDTLVIFDRSVDLVTPLLTQLTYEGLIDELFDMKCGQSWIFINITATIHVIKLNLGVVKLPKEKFAASDDTAATSTNEENDRLPRAKVSSELKELMLSRTDDLFMELRDLNFSAVGPVIKKTVRAISDQMEVRVVSNVSIRTTFNCCFRRDILLQYENIRNLSKDFPNYKSPDKMRVFTRRLRNWLKNKPLRISFSSLSTVNKRFLTALKQTE